MLPISSGHIAKALVFGGGGGGGGGGGDDQFICLSLNKIRG